MELRGSQRKHLRGLAHELRPAVQVGKEGLSGAVLAAVEDAFAQLELIKVKLAGDRRERASMATTIEESLGCACVGLIGSIGIFYRRHPDPEKRRIDL
ncbi:MAG TPA: YhbY family RNA-binding protein [Thermoanaerobaculaceae bacterium]|nr:YhbY family RNA-binding protein [Thermoanaerobaculaceae bacterium]HRS15691.1 YhbY family RNA-binding protein [Thermoanaerobaculaceae bacterium]